MLYAIVWRTDFWVHVYMYVVGKMHLVVYSTRLCSNAPLLPSELLAMHEPTYMYSSSQVKVGKYIYIHTHQVQPYLSDNLMK